MLTFTPNFRAPCLKGREWDNYNDLQITWYKIEFLSKSSLRIWWLKRVLLWMLWKGRYLKDFVCCRLQRSWAGLDSPGHSVNNLFEKRTNIIILNDILKTWTLFIGIFHLQDKFWSHVTCSSEVGVTWTQIQNRFLRYSVNFDIQIWYFSFKVYKKSMSPQQPFSPYCLVFASTWATAMWRPSLVHQIFSVFATCSSRFVFHQSLINMHQITMVCLQNSPLR